MTASTDAALSGAILISAPDLGKLRQTREQLVALMADDMESLAGVTPETMADEIIANAKEFSIANAASGLAKLPLLVITSDDGYAPVAAALVNEIAVRNGKKVKTTHIATDHSY